MATGITKKFAVTVQLEVMGLVVYVFPAKQGRNFLGRTFSVPLVASYGGSGNYCRFTRSKLTQNKPSKPINAITAFIPSAGTGTAGAMTT